MREALNELQPKIKQAHNMKTQTQTAQVNETLALKKVEQFEKDIDEVLALGEGPLVLAGDEDYVRA